MDHSAVDKKDIFWYVIHTFSSYETVVSDNLKKMIENNGLQDYIVEISVPVEKEIIEKENGKKKVVERKKFPGYVFVKMAYTDHVWYMITNTRGVTGFVGPMGQPLPLTAEETKRMGLEKIVAEDFAIKAGDSVKIISGALDTFIALVDEVIFERQKVKAIVQMFGRQTPVELDFNQIEKI